MNLFISELKRQISGRRFIAYILISIILAILWGWFIIGGKTEDFMQTGCYKNLKGIEAIEAAAKDRNVYSGKMTIDNFQKSGEVFLNSLNEESEIIMNDDLKKLAVYADKLVMEKFKLGKINGDTDLESMKFPKDFGSHYYENEDTYYENRIDLETKNEEEKELALKMWNEVAKPYIYYGGFETWGDGIDHIQLFTFVILIIVGFFSSGIIAKDKESGLDEIISTTKKGRKNLVYPKLLLPLIMGSLIYIVGMGIYIMILKHYLPANALETSVQVLGSTIVPYNLGEMMKKMIAFGFVGVITIAAFTTFISSISKKTSTVISIIVLVIISGFVLSIMMASNNVILDIIKFILPGSIVFAFCDMTVPVVSIFGKGILSFNLSLIISLLWIFISLILSGWTYVRRK